MRSQQRPRKSGAAACLSTKHLGLQHLLLFKVTLNPPAERLLPTHPGPSKRQPLKT